MAEKMTRAHLDKWGNNFSWISIKCKFQACSSHYFSLTLTQLKYHFFLVWEAVILKRGGIFPTAGLVAKRSTLAAKAYPVR